MDRGTITFSKQHAIAQVCSPPLSSTAPEGGVLEFQCAADVHVEVKMSVSVVR